MSERISLTAMTEVWGHALESQTVNPADNFYDLGGHSLAAAQIVQRLETLVGIRLPVLAVFDHPTPGALTSLVNRWADDAGEEVAT